VPYRFCSTRASRSLIIVWTTPFRISWLVLLSLSLSLPHHNFLPHLGNLKPSYTPAMEPRWPSL